MNIPAAIIGAGTVAWKFHFPVLKQCDSVQVVGVCDEDPGRLAAARDFWNCRGYLRWWDLLNDCRPEILYVFLPPYAHGEVELAAAARGVHLFVEKPVANDVRVARRVAAAVKASGIVAAVGYQWRYLDTVAALREALADARAAIALGRWLGNTPEVGWWRQQALSGGQVVEQTTHLIDLARFLCGEAVSVSGAGTNGRNPSPPPYDIHDATSVCIVFQSGLVATFISTNLLLDPSFLPDMRVDLSFYGPNFAARLDRRSLRIRSMAGEKTVSSAGNPFAAEHAAFLTAVNGGNRASILCDYEDAARTVGLTLVALEAIEGRTVLSTEIEREVAAVVTARP